MPLFFTLLIKFSMCKNHAASITNHPAHLPPDFCHEDIIHVQCITVAEEQVTRSLVPLNIFRNPHTRHVPNDQWILHAWDVNSTNYIHLALPEMKEISYSHSE